MSFANLRDQCQKMYFVEIPNSCHKNHVKRIIFQRASGRQRLLMPKAALHFFFSLGLDLHNFSCFLQTITIGFCWMKESSCAHRMLQILHYLNSFGLFYMLQVNSSELIRPEQEILKVTKNTDWKSKICGMQSLGRAFDASLSKFCKIKPNTFTIINQNNIENLPIWKKKKTKFYNRNYM